MDAEKVPKFFEKTLEDAMEAAVSYYDLLMTLDDLLTVINAEDATEEALAAVPY